MTTAYTGDDQLYFHTFLAPLQPLLRRSDVTDLYINRPGELWTEALGGKIERHEMPELTEQLLMRLAKQIAAVNHQGISREHPLLSASLPSGERVQIVAPPATRGPPAFAIRKHVSPDLRLQDYVATGAFADTKIGTEVQGNQSKAGISEMLSKGDVTGALVAAVRARLTILVSGGTSSGKTTFLNSLISEIDPAERLIFIEDTPELKMQHENAVGLLAPRSILGEAQVTANDLVSASLRMRPDRIILGELRGEEAFSFLRAINTGHPGSMTTIHANSPVNAVEQIILLVMQGGTRLSCDDVRNYVRNIVDVYVHLGRTAAGRVIDQVIIA